MRAYDLVAFDVDGTLIESDDGETIWEVLNRRVIGSNKMNRHRYAQYRQGKLSYAGWVALDVGGWQEAGARREDLVAGCLTQRLASGARETMNALLQAGCRLVAISGTLDLLLDTLYPDHPFEQVYSNRIRFDAHGKIAGWEATPFDMEGKARALALVSERTGVPLARCAYVGDSTNDVWIARAAGFTVARNPRCEELERLADAVVRSDDMRDLLPHLLPETGGSPPSGCK